MKAYGRRLALAIGAAIGAALVVAPWVFAACLERPFTNVTHGTPGMVLTETICGCPPTDFKGAVIGLLPTTLPDPKTGTYHIVEPWRPVPVRSAATEPWGGTGPIMVTRFTFVIPDLAPGHYVVAPRCPGSPAPTELVEGAEVRIDALPATDTLQTDRETAPPKPVLMAVGWLLLLGGIGLAVRAGRRPHRG